MEIIKNIANPAVEIFDKIKFMGISNFKFISSDEQKNMELITNTVKGNIKFVVSDNITGGISPVTIPYTKGLNSLKEVISFNLNAKEIASDNRLSILDLINKIRKALSNKLEITKSGDIINISSDEEITVYVPSWFFKDKINTGVNGIVNITNDQRIGVILHEVGHWTKTSSIFNTLSVYSSFIGGLIALIAFIKLITVKKSENTNIQEAENLLTKIYQKVKNKVKNMVKITYNNVDILLLRLFYLITSVIGFMVYLYVAESRNLFNSFAESYADSVVVKFGYGPATAEIIKNLGSPPGTEIDTNINKFTSLIDEFKARLATPYPSINWRFKDLLESEDISINNDSQIVVETLESLVKEGIIEDTFKALDSLLFAVDFILGVITLIFGVLIASTVLNSNKKHFKYVKENDINTNIQKLIIDASN